MSLQGFRGQSAFRIPLSKKKKKASEKSQVSLLSLFYVTNTGF